MRSAKLEHALARLETILVEVWDEYPGGGPVDHDASLLSLGVDSLTLVMLLDRLESEFHAEWDPDRPPSAFSSLRSLAESVTSEQPDGAARK
ncbi:acyl carrier protein [Streptomyces sp. ISL-100]|uniref:acyl carrier protein n=1 Tax=Streptomyces sp. ISL-100 TaxID=2819173 RepID=UPI001BEB8C18|nr:acyl carrier protein [Streptomyces sp. ISL-100]